MISTLPNAPFDYERETSLSFIVTATDMSKCAPRKMFRVFFRFIWLMQICLNSNLWNDLSECGWFDFVECTHFWNMDNVSAHWLMIFISVMIFTLCYTFWWSRERTYQKVIDEILKHVYFRVVCLCVWIDGTSKDRQYPRSAKVSLDVVIEDVNDEPPTLSPVSSHWKWDNRRQQWRSNLDKRDGVGGVFFLEQSEQCPSQRKCEKRIRGVFFHIGLGPWFKQRSPTFHWLARNDIH